MLTFKQILAIYLLSSLLSILDIMKLNNKLWFQENLISNDSYTIAWFVRPTSLIKILKQCLQCSNICNRLCTLNLWRIQRLLAQKLPSKVFSLTNQLFFTIIFSESSGFQCHTTFEKRISFLEKIKFIFYPFFMKINISTPYLQY